MPMDKKIFRQNEDSYFSVRVGAVILKASEMSGEEMGQGFVVVFFFTRMERTEGVCGLVERLRVLKMCRCY
ncbi:hypothetical protein C1H46_014930 [Malus baccata]|uniref:Uncharacterized protein n=1 Tax=Malus baccata TaxID=106549 RepID=A0A540MKX3_MALBA|nr:hypothetical protein C1H46_014930 [Malus baccata]